MTDITTTAAAAAPTTDGQETTPKKAAKPATVRKAPAKRTAAPRKAAPKKAAAEPTAKKAAAPRKAAPRKAPTTPETPEPTPTETAKPEAAETTPAETAVAKKVIEPTTVSKRREAAADKAEVTKAEVGAKLKTIPIDRIDRDPNQPREVFDQEKLKELASSLQELGQLQAITVRYTPANKRYVLVMGERRWRAAQMAGLTEMHAMVMHGLAGGAETFARSVAENVSRADMTPMEEARAFHKLAGYGFEPTEIAKQVGRSWNYVDLRLSLLKLVPAAQEALLKNHITVGLAWYVSQISEKNQNAFIARWARGLFSGQRDAEAFCTKVRAEEAAAASQSVMFVLAEEVHDPDNESQGGMFAELELSIDERDQIASDRKALVRKIDNLSKAGEILSEIAAMDPGTLAILLSGAHGGIPGNRMRIDHLKDVAAKASTNIRQAAAVASVRAGALRVAPDAEAPQTTTTEAA
ncbi:ParB/RepB/Spo0J family partition protein [Streptomyces sp. NPDC056708]|uniref:ParB/RepB/Spo0J family partition protein n=1 Tax=unclassified Streptomyces TaxID=2593676 RepID=UPI0036CA052D